jgi:hypothetical protein
MFASTLASMASSCLRPVFIRKRTPEMIQSSKKDDCIAPSMREPATDAERCKKPEWLICIGSGLRKRGREALHAFWLQRAMSTAFVCSVLHSIKKLERVRERS